MGRSASVPCRKIGYQTIPSLAVGNDGRPVGIIIFPVGSCLPDFDPGSGQRSAINSGADSAGKNITAADCAAQRRVGTVKRADLIPGRRLTFLCRRDRCVRNQESGCDAEEHDVCKSVHVMSVPPL